MEVERKLRRWRENEVNGGKIDLERKKKRDRE